MADTLDNVILEKDVWVDIYAATGISQGAKIFIQNVGARGVHLYAGEAIPTGTSGFNILSPLLSFVNDPVNSGAWVKAPYADSVINVSEVTS